MARQVIRFNKADLAKWNKALSQSDFRKRLKAKVGKATGQNAFFIRSRAIAQIKDGRLEKNADLTVAIKRSSKPLFDLGDLQVSAVQKRWNQAFVGVLRTDEKFNIAEFLHEGGRIPVTQKMRNLFRILWIASMAAQNGTRIPPLTGRAAELFERYQNWLPLKDSTRMIKVPKRPFLLNAFNDPAVKKFVRDNWSRAINEALKP